MSLIFNFRHFFNSLLCSFCSFFLFLDPCSVCSFCYLMLHASKTSLSIQAICSCCSVWNWKMMRHSMGMAGAWWWVDTTVTDGHMARWPIHWGRYPEILSQMPSNFSREDFSNHLIYYLSVYFKQRHLCLDVPLLALENCFSAEFQYQAARMAPLEARILWPSS